MSGATPIAARPRRGSDSPLPYSAPLVYWPRDAVHREVSSGVPVSTFSIPMDIGSPDGEHWEHLDALVDTGSSYTSVPRDLLSRIGIRPRFRRRFRTADERLIEAAWGLGEAVVNGAVTPDRIRLAPDGRSLDYEVGDKDIKVWYGDDDGTIEVSVEPERRNVPCLTGSHLAALHELAERCVRVWGPRLDVEWALGEDGTMYLLQCRPITTPPSMSA